ncbi:16S rRNA (cytosine967-C5)-methyltransferase [Rhodobium orientis]|uniref:MFS transporter n=1 Tax=Rhodobium orientis TaxID=34017 RepID=A0A327JSC9_9HYPH|nr:RsmB/NOP family class I SAM-dependent RNA methyltransferase [Rhodobium orientis]MBB4302585.1 16S rRNA (cytosine967-C5)-methyltransferase [Rhodobium orientis]MBK5951545.1 MFS transporter [Rhodobium orientis]RAI29137.1 MFS transporter [Rhodobium orientis]
MKDGGRLMAAIEIIDDILSRRRPAADALKDWGLAHRFAGSGDRAAIGNLVFDALRRRLSLAWRMGDDNGRALVLGAYVTMWGKDLADLDAVLGDDRHAPEPLGDAERAALAGEVRDGAPDHVLADVPDWLWPEFVAAFGERAVDEGRALADRAPLDLRVNTLKADREKVMKALSRFGAVETPLSPVGLRIAAPDGPKRLPHVQSEDAFRKGWFEIQDEASQLAALLAGGLGGGQTVDYCAGAGGKTLALAAQSRNAGQIYAHDADQRRFGDIRERLKRAGVRNVQLRGPDGDTLSDLEGRADTVLVDAPCTGTGTWRRRPDAKWRVAPGALELRIAEQEAVLAEAARLVKPGGHLVYATCSLLAAENEGRIAAFLDANPGFRLAAPGDAWLAATGEAMPEGLRAAVGDRGDCARLTPATSGTDGFFVALMQRAE